MEFQRHDCPLYKIFLVDLNTGRRELPQSRQQALQRTLEAAAKQMLPTEKRRPGSGPPPLLSLVRPLPGAEAAQPRRVVLGLGDAQAQGLADGGALAGSINPFIYDPYRVQACF